MNIQLFVMVAMVRIYSQIIQFSFVHGGCRKKWILFPPSDSEYMYPTRIPYEESSVFSLVNIARPDLDKHPQFQVNCDLLNPSVPIRLVNIR